MSIIKTLSAISILILSAGLLLSNFYLFSRIGDLESRINMVSDRDIRTDYDIYALVMGNKIAGSVLSNLDIPLSDGTCDITGIPISNIHFGNIGVQIWFNDFEKKQTMATLVNETKIYMVGAEKISVSADEFCEIIRKK